MYAEYSTVPYYQIQTGIIVLPADGSLGFFPCLSLLDLRIVQSIN